MTTIKSIIEAIENSDINQPMTQKQIFDIILPKKSFGSIYTIQEVDESIHNIRNEVEKLQKERNDNFKVVMDVNSLDRLENLYQSLHKVQFNTIKLQCDIAFVKEQYRAVDRERNHKDIIKRKQLNEQRLTCIQFLKDQTFAPVQRFLNNMVNFLEFEHDRIKADSINRVRDYAIAVDWGFFHEIIASIRACGKTLFDIERVERLYQSDEIRVIDMQFKQPETGLKDYHEFPKTFSLETQLLLSIDGEMDNPMEFKNLLTSDKRSYQAIIESEKQISFTFLREAHETLKSSLNAKFCQLLVELNMNYIEAHLTEGIDIDKLNGCEGSSTIPLKERQALPKYAIIPQEYITQIGQHLLTLNSHVRHFDTDIYLNFGLRALQEVRDITFEIGQYKNSQELIKKCISKLTIRSLLARTGSSLLKKLTSSGRRQLATDALYLDNVLEDLKLLDPDDQDVHKFKSLLSVV